jgi:hypothetical protein
MAGTIFWIVTIAECATKESASGNDKLIWILIIIFRYWIRADLVVCPPAPTHRGSGRLTHAWFSHRL